VTRTEELEAISWDVIVIGTGMGGGTIGYELSRLGRRILYIEKGHSSIAPGDAGIIGSYPEENFDLARITDQQHDNYLARGGRNTEWFLDSTPGVKPKLFRPLVGSGTGGSSALYGMVTERFFREDFTPRGNFADVGDSTVPESWPVSYNEMLPWYRKAEQLYRVRGTADPVRPGDDVASLLPPRQMTAANAEVADFLADRGMHPYNLHVACEYTDQCVSCSNIICKSGCKNYSGNICVEPAVRCHGAALLDQATVTRLEATRTAVTGVIARRRGETFRFTGKVVVLAASALMTPVLLLNSASADWPAGLANDHDLVGRNLMRHFIDIYLFRVRCAEPVGGQVKEISFNDFYQADGHKLGTVQSLGQVPPYDFLMNASRPGRRVLGPLRRLGGRPWKRLVQDRFVVLASIMEDLPYAGNRILPGPGSVSKPGPYLELRYTMGAPDIRRHREFTGRLRATMSRYRGSRVSPVHLSGAKLNSGLGHQSGTCRFGDDPKTSVLDPANRAWGLDNLYVVDTSMLPSSAGINPSLTIAANALRVAQVISGSL
jgi:choline dehydrogenase-like flavoprotein